MKKAIEWWMEAASQYQSTAQYNLGHCYENGKAVPKDMQKARELYKKAAAQGEDNAIAACKRLGIKV